MALAIIFDSIGVGEWLVLLAVVLVVVGPKRLPATARTIGKHYAKFRRAADSFKRQLMEMDTEINRAVEEAQREAEAAVGVDDFTDDMMGDPMDMEGESREHEDESSVSDDEESVSADAAPHAPDASSSADADDAENVRREPYGD